MAPSLTTLIATRSRRVVGKSSGDSKGSARMTLENVPRPRDLSATYRTGERIQLSSDVRQYSRSYRQFPINSGGVRKFHL